ncbi:hypothetical protein CONLIGDRAFT_699880 [Coniochaeta ligniaria NRRL 30616]|uniref:Uncharacterized protein n=1 Tax=Coniochaeta ligniaria NRRL 30616 TaxID=1408157 RepID=A0A1J7ISH3_9PEZI|nr:hypothetical protein CONLIGDRAFT_699880 [Coniochaeta ligniaria NRRL 30616]
MLHPTPHVRNMKRSIQREHSARTGPTSTRASTQDQGATNPDNSSGFDSGISTVVSPTRAMINALLTDFEFQPQPQRGPQPQVPTHPQIGPRGLDIANCHSADLLDPPRDRSSEPYVKAPHPVNSCTQVPTPTPPSVATDLATGIESLISQTYSHLRRSASQINHSMASLHQVKAAYHAERGELCAKTAENALKAKVFLEDNNELLARQAEWLREEEELRQKMQTMERRYGMGEEEVVEHYMMGRDGETEREMETGVAYDEGLFDDDEEIGDEEEDDDKEDPGDEDSRRSILEWYSGLQPNTREGLLSGLVREWQVTGE